MKKAILLCFFPILLGCAPISTEKTSEKVTSHCESVSQKEIALRKENIHEVYISNGNGNWAVEESFYSQKTQDCVYVLTVDEDVLENGTKIGLDRRKYLFTDQGELLATALFTEDDKYRSEPLFFNFIVREYRGGDVRTDS